MFWKKKTGVEEEAEDAREDLAVNAKPRESLDFAAARQASAGHDHPAEPEALDADDAAPEKLGLVARMKLRLGALARHFKKPAAFRAEEDRAPEEAEDAAYMEPDLRLDAPARPGLSMRIKMQVAGLVRRFRKAPAADTEEGEGGETEGTAGSQAGRVGLLGRIRIAFGAFARALKTPTVAEAGDEAETESRDGSEVAPEEEPAAGEAAAARAHPRMWVVVGGAIIIAILLLFSIVIAHWPIFEPPQKRWGTRHDITSISSRRAPSEPASDVSPAPAAERPQAEIDALMKKNAELQARLDALKSEKGTARALPAPSAMQSGKGAAAPPTPIGDMVVGNTDAKAAAMSLKGAIDAMNAGSGDYGKDGPNKQAR